MSLVENIIMGQNDLGLTSIFCPSPVRDRLAEGP